MNVSPNDLFARNYNALIKQSGSTDFFKTVKNAAIIRQFIIDQDALTHIVNRNFKLKIYFEVDDTFINQLTSNATILYTSNKINHLKIEFSVRLKKLKLPDFLALKILKIDSEQFDVKEIIKYAANKQGGVHFDPKINSEEEKLKIALDKVDNVPVLALVINSIVDIVLIALKPLKETLLSFPSYSNFLAHYDLRDQGSIFFEGKQFLEADNLNNDPISNGFGWFGEIKVIHQKYSGKRYIYEVGKAQKNGFNFSIYINEKGDLYGTTRINKSTQLSVKYLNFKHSCLFNNDISLGIILMIENNIARLEIWVNNELIDKVEEVVINTFQNIDRHVIGGNLKGKQNATFYIKEILLLTNGLNKESILNILKYLERKRRDY